MNIAKISGVRIAAVYACMPQLEIDNLEALVPLYGAEAKSVVKATGIKKRFLAEPGTSSLDLCCTAAKQLLEEQRVEKEEIGGIVSVSFTPETLLPGNAGGVQQRLGLSKDMPAVDLSMACSGYVYGLWFAGFMATTYQKKILLLDGDIQSAYLSGLDKSTTPVLSDAGTATLVEPDRMAKDWYFSFYTDGAGRSALMIPAGGSGRPIQEADLLLTEHEDGMKRRDIDIFMDGFAIFRFVAQDVAAKLKGFMEELSITPKEVDWFVPHQANIFMVKRLAKEVGFEKEVTWISGDIFGNSASATVPVTIAKCARASLDQERKSKILLTGFGGGLSISCALIELDAKAGYQVIFL